MEPTQPTSSAREICVNPADFDISRLVIHDACVREFKIGESKISNTTSSAKYLNDEGEECTLYFRGPPQNCFGVQYNYPMGVAEEDKTPETAKGLQVCYPLTTMQTVSDPTDDEKAHRDMILALWQAAVDKGIEESERDEPVIPGVSVNSFRAIAGAKKKDWTKAVKVPFSHPKNKENGGKTLDTTKPESMYVKLVTDGQGPTLKAKTPFWGPGDRKCNALKFLDVRGEIEPCWVFEGIYYGAHGTSPHGASLRFRLAEANYTPKSASSSLPQHRMLSRNTAPVEEDDGGYPAARGVEEPGEDEGFTAPGGDSTNPVAALSKAAKASAGKTTNVVPAKKATAKTPAKTVLTKDAKPTKSAKAQAVPAKPATKAKVPAKAKPAPKKKVPEPEDEPEEVVEEENDVEEDEE